VFGNNVEIKLELCNGENTGKGCLYTVVGRLTKQQVIVLAELLISLYAA
jgi:hypothetical protein